MNSEDNSFLSFDIGQKMMANQVLSNIYTESHPRIHLQTGFTTEDLPTAVRKVNRGFNILLELCNLELNHYAFIDDLISADYQSLESLQKPAFAEGGYLGYVVSRDALWLLDLLRSTNRYDQVDYEDITAPLYEFFKLCVKANAGMGDMYMMLCQALFIACTFDESYELEITRDVIRQAQLEDFTLNRWLLGVLSDLDKHLAKDSTFEDKVSVVRFWDKDYVVAYATNDFVKFDELDLKMEKKSRYNDDYVHGQVYRNDKQFPDNPADWLNIVLPEDSDSFILGRRTYETMEEAEESEREFMNWLQALLDD